VRLQSLSDWQWRLTLHALLQLAQGRKLDLEASFVKNMKRDAQTSPGRLS